MSWRRLRTLLRREVRATLRDPFTVTILTTVPLAALLTFGFVLSTEVNDLALGVHDASGTPASRRLVADLGASGTFDPRPFATREGLERFTVYRWFADPASRDVYVAKDHPAHERVFVAELRAASARSGERSRAAEVVHALLETSPEFAERWAEHEVAAKHPRTKRFAHAELGEFALDCQTLLDTDTGQRLLVFTAAHGSADAEKLALLAVIGTQSFAAG